MNSLKRLLSLLLVMVMLLNTMPMSALATDVPGDEGTSQQEPAAQEPSEDQPEETPNPEETPEQPAVDTQEGEDEGTVNPPVNEESPAPEDDSAPPVDGDNNPPAEPTPVEKVQAMIDALVIPDSDNYDSETEYAADIKALDRTLADVADEMDALTEEQYSQLNLTNFIEAVWTVDGYLYGRASAVALGDSEETATVYTMNVGVTSINGSTLREFVRDTHGASTDRHFYANGTQFTKGNTGYNADDSKTFGEGVYHIEGETRSGSFPSYKYTKKSLGYVRIVAAKAEAVIELNSEPYEVLVNGDRKYKDPDLAENILDAVVKSTNHDGQPSVQAYYQGYSQYDSGYYDLDNNIWVANNLEPGKTVKVKISWPATANFPAKVVQDVEVTLKESRKAPTITISQTKFSVNTQADFEAAVKAALVVTDSNGAVIAPELEVTFSEYTFPGKVSFTAKVTNNGESWIAGGETTLEAEGVIATYTVTWLDDDGTELEKDVGVLYGSTPEYNGETPTKEATAQYTYTFKGWDKEVGAVTGDVTYTATFTEAAREYTISWDTNGDGTVDTTTQVAFGTVPTAPSHADRSDENLSPDGWDKEIVAVTGDALYTAKYSNDTVYKITFVVDGVEDPQYVNVTKGGKVTVPADPDKEYAVFGGWDKEIVETPTEDAVYKATWLTDANDNNVVDTDETVTLTAAVTGSGTVAPVANDNIVITENADGTWTVLYNSKVQDANVIAITATPKDTKADDGSVDYLISSDETIDLTTDTVINAEFGTVSVGVQEELGTVKVNMYKADAEYVAGLKTKILAAVGITENAANFTVTATVGFNSLGSWATTTATIEDDSVRGPVLGRDTDLAAALSSELNDKTSLAFTITRKAAGFVPAVSQVVNIPLADSRPLPVVSASKTEIEFKAKEEIATVVSDVQALFSIKDNNGTVVAVSDSYVKWNETYTWPADAATNTYTVTVQVPNSETYRESNAVTVNVTVVDTTIRYTVKYMDGQGGELHSEVVSEFLATPTIADPTREYYTFGGWTPAVAETVTADATYTAQWNPEVDGNGNGIADQEETYTVIYVLGNGEANVTHENLAYGAGTPAAPELKWEGYNFKGWSPAVAANVSAPAEGNTITYTAQWTRKHAVIFMNNGTQYGEGVEVENEGLVAEPDAPVWDDDHDFLGWYLDEEKYDFTKPVTGSLTLTAKWRTDFNRNDIEDSKEDHYTVIYNVDGVETRHENILTGMPTPEMEDPTKTGYKFDGWDPEVAEKVTANVTYTAQWLNDANNNGVDDTLETITINVTAANEGDKVTVTGAQLIEGTSDYIYDSTGTGEITIQAVPVTALDGLKRISTTYVHGIAVDEVPAALTYADNYSVTYSFTAADGQVVDVEFKAAGFVYNEERLLNFYPGMTGVVLDDVYNTIVDTPDLPGEYTLKYFARPASKHTVQLSSLGLPDTIMTVLKMIGQESITIDMPDLWLDVEVNDLSEEIENAVSLDQACAQYLTYDRIVGLWDIFQNNGGVKAVTAELQAITDNIKNAAMYYGAHSFGYNASDAQTVTERIQVTYKNETRSIEGESTIDLKDLRAPAQILGSNVSVIYRDYTDEDLIALIAPQAADMDGNALTGAVVTCADITDPYTFEGKYVSDTAYELKFKFAGNETHKPAEAVYTVTVTKASASLDVPNQVVTYGDAYSMLAPEYFTLGNEYGDPAEVAESMIQFVIGLDVAQLDVDQDGVNGLNGKVQLILPEELQSMLDGILGLTGGDTSNGMEMSLSELTKYLEMIPDTSLDILNQALNAIASISEAGDVTITLGGDLPRNIGAYLYGTVSTCANYTTAYDVAYLVIKPDAARVYLDWNYDAENGIFTSTLLKEGNLSASAFNDEAFTELNQEATEMVQSVVFGININGDVVAELFAENADPEQIENLLDNGAYTQLAYVLDFGNTMNYAVPIARAFAITPDTVIVCFVDAAGENRDRHFVYDNRAHGMDVLVTTKDGEELLDTRKGQTSEALTVFYAGVQADGTTYTTQEAPVNSGIYTVSAFYKSVDANGKIDLVGADVGVMAIEPAASSVTVANKHTEFGTAADVAGMVTASSAVEGVTPQVTIITAGINTDGTFSENGLSAVQGVVNMDLPAWVDSYLKENKYLEAAYADGITKQVAIEYFNKASALLEEALGFDLFLGTVDLISQLPDSVTITFHDLPAAEPTAVGAYLVAAVVTDPNHYPSFHAGILTIRPANIEKAELSWVYEDSNNIFIKETLTYKLVDMSAEAKLDGEALDVNPTELFLGVDAENWTIKLCKDQTQLTAGVYTEFGFLVTADSNLSYYAEPIHREIVVLDGVYTVVFKDENGNVNHDRTFTYDGTPKAIGTAHVIPGQFAGENTTLTVVYTGMMANGDMYRSTEAPTNAGVYTAVAIFKEMDENGKIIGTGAGIGAMVIRKAELALDFVDTTVAYDAQEHMIDVTSNDGTADYLTVVIDKQANIVNIILEDDTTIIAQKLAELLKEELGVQNLTGEFDVTEVQQALHRIADTVLKIQIPEELKSVVNKFPEDKQAELNGLIADFEVYKANLDAVVKQIKDLMPVSGKVVFNGKLPVDAGTYQFYGLALSANYNPEATQGTLVIEPVEVTVIMDSFTVEAGDPMPVMTFTAVGVIGDDQLVVTPACTAEDTNTPGVYQITGQVQADPNYIFQPVTPGTLTVVKISLSSDSLELEVGDKDQITVSVLPEDQNYTVTYSSSDETVATVDENGNVTALAEGKVTITVTVTLENGASFTKTLEVNVKPAMVPIKGFQPGQVVEILGKEFVADENGIVWLAQAEHDAVVSDTLIATSYDYGASSLADPNGVAEHQQYPTNMYVWYLNYNSQADEYTAEPISELTDFLTYKGTSIRWGTREKNGIRVITAVDEGDRAALIKGNLLSHQALSGFRLVEYGTLIRRADANGDFIYGAKSVQASRAYFNSEDRIFHRDNGDIWYTGAFVDLKDELCSMELLLRSYMILEKDGEQIVIHGGVLQRNIGYVALQNKDTYAPGQDAYDFIWNIIRNVYGDKVQG